MTTMPPKQAPANPADKIKSCLTLDLCCSTTVSQLDDFLFGSTPAKPSKSRTAAPAVRKRSTVGDNGAASAATQLERHRLAVEVVNATMRGLLEAAQTGTVPSTLMPGTPVSAAPTKKPTRPPAASAKVLQTRSLNRNDKPVTELDSLDHLALCCSMATTFLQSLDPAQGIPESKPLQTENTRSILATKLMQLGRYKFALSEWKKLKRRLEELIQKEAGVESWVVQDETSAPAKTAKKPVSTSSKPTGAKGCPAVGEEVDKEGFSRVLEFAQPSSTSPFLPLVIVCQLGILRCVAGLKRPDMVEAGNSDHTWSFATNFRTGYATIVQIWSPQPAL